MAAATVAGLAADAVDAQAVAMAGHAAGGVARKARVLRRRLQPQQEDRQMPAAKKAVRLVTEETESAPAEVAVAEPATAEPQSVVPAGPYLRITLFKSGTGYKYDQKRTLAALGLRRLNATVERPDNASVRGMLTKVQHLVRVEEIGQS